MNEEYFKSKESKVKGRSNIKICNVRRRASGHEVKHIKKYCYSKYSTFINCAEEELEF